jgi:periodic tryptophan protein 2
MEPFVQIKKINTGHTEDITALFWSPDSRFICTSSKDCNVYMHNVFSLPDFVVQKFVGHRKKVLQAFWSADMKSMYTMGKDGVLYFWSWKSDFVTQEYKNMIGYQGFRTGKKLKVAGEHSETNTMYVAEDMDIAREENPLFSDYENHFKEGRWILETKKQFFQDGTQLKSAEFSPKASLLLLGYKNGIFGLYRIEGTETISLQVFSVTDKKISHLTFNHTSEWVAMASEEEGQLMIWEWRSQTCR